MMTRQDLSGDALSAALRGLLVAGVLPCGFIMLAAAGTGVTVSVAQNRGVRIRPALLRPKWSRINPVENLKHILSARALVRLGKSLVPVVLLALQLVHFVSALRSMPAFSLVRLPQVLGEAYELLVNTSWILLGWSLVDYAVEWRQWEQRLRMSKQELKEEFKESEVNPQLKGRIRSLQRQMRGRNLRAEVKKATVVITNPTHYAVALAFDFSSMEAPRVLAKGRDLVAAQIRDEARWASIPVVENPPLARSLYRAVEPGQSIPPELYAAVAAILAYLFRQEAEQRARREQGARQARRQAPAPGGLGLASAHRAAAPGEVIR
jgi:flagellar biosynthetic protein FlhB